MRTRPVAPRAAARPDLDVHGNRREGRLLTVRRSAGAAIAAAAFVAMLGACSPSASNVPLPSVNLSALPSINASAIASAASGAALTALDAVDQAIAANQSSNTLTADEATSLTQLTAALRTALQSGDTTGIQTALTNLSTKVDSFASKLSASPAGKQLTDAMTALKAAIPAS
jgi:hypothetical protein